MADQTQTDDFGVKERLDIQKEVLRLELQNIFRKRKKISIQDVNAGNIPELVMEDLVFVQGHNSHIYPWLLSEASKLIGYNEEQAQDFAEREAKHEYEHNNVMPGDRKHVFGVRFFEVVDEKGNYYSDGILPEFLYFGEVSPEEEKIILSGPSNSSPSDKRKIKEIDANLT